MNSNVLVCLTILCVLLFLGLGNAADATTYNWTWSGAVSKGSGTLITGGSCGGTCEVITSITGTIAGKKIDAISSLDTYPSLPGQGNDNKLFPLWSVILDKFGLAFALVSNSEANISCYPSASLCYLYIQSDGSATSDPGAFTISLHAPPAHHSSRAHFTPDWLAILKI
jgi:hypothetical protein